MGKHEVTRPAEPKTALGRVAEAFEVIDRADSRINAWVFLDKERALSVAKKCDETCYNGELYGTVIAVKDIYDTSDMPTTYGSPIYRNYQPSRDASIVSQLREAGAVVLGKTATTEFASSFPASTRNPLNMDHTPGGSSSGSAAAVASGMVSIALGSQTLGSIIRPASYCGIVGFKPSYGRLSRAGVLSLSETLDTLGFLGKSVDEIARLYRCLTGDRKTHDFTRAQPAIAFCKAPGWEHTSIDARNAIAAYIERLNESGATVSHIELPAEFDQLPDAGRTIHDFEVRRNFTWERLHHFEMLSKNFQEILTRGEKVSVEQYEESIRIGERCRARFEKMMSYYDMLITLSATDEAPKDLTVTGTPAVNIAWTLLRGPCVSLPKLVGASQMPIGIQLIGPQFSDATLLAGASWLERHG